MVSILKSFKGFSSLSVRIEFEGEEEKRRMGGLRVSRKPKRKIFISRSG